MQAHGVSGDQRETLIHRDLAQSRSLNRRSQTGGDEAKRSIGVASSDLFVQRDITFARGAIRKRAVQLEVTGRRA